LDLYPDARRAGLWDLRCGGFPSQRGGV
jgi:hypothetical protein